MIRFPIKLPRVQTFHDFGQPDAFKAWMRGAMWAAGVFCVLGLLLCACVEGCGGKRGKAAGGGDKQTAAKKTPPPDLRNPVRAAPAAFPPDSNLPRGKEIYASGPIDLATFDPKRDLVRFEDRRVWFESDHSNDGDDEDDHLIHRAMEVPLMRLVNLLERKGGTLKVQDAYRHTASNRIHTANSLHCEGRAIDLTCEKVNMGDLAKLCWQAGFDFVLYEVPRKSGVHLHCSVKRSPDAPLPPRP